MHIAGTLDLVYATLSTSVIGFSESGGVIKEEVDLPSAVAVNSATPCSAFAEDPGVWQPCVPLCFLLALPPNLFALLNKQFSSNLRCHLPNNELW